MGLFFKFFIWLRKKTYYIFLFFFLVITQTAWAQLPDFGQAPSNIKWRYIDTEHFRIIYADSFGREAQRMSNLCEYLYDKEHKTLKSYPKRISIVLQNQGTDANAYVRLAPRMAEFFTTPPQEFETTDWLNTLAVHELRHVMQFDALAGFLKHIPFTDLWVLASAYSIPFWFFEGDAVIMETALSNAGRGRLPSWEMSFRANLLSGKRFSYAKSYLGSYNDVVPDYYRLGYFMLGKLRRDEGVSVLDDFVANRYFFGIGFKKASKGLNTHLFYEKTLDDLKNLWQKQLTQIKPLPADYILRSDSVEKSNFLLPKKMKNGNIICLKESFNRTACFIEIGGEKEINQLKYIGQQDDANFSLSKNLLAWSESRKDPRYRKRVYSVICTYSLDKRKSKQITKKSRLFAPALSPNTKRIVAVKIGYDNAINLVELNSETGKEIKCYRNPERWMLQNPSYSVTGDSIVVTAVAQTGKAILLIDTKQEKQHLLTGFTNQQISRPVFAKKYIVYKAHYNGIDNLYAIDLMNLKIVQLGSARFGAFNPYYDTFSDTILYNDYECTGYSIAQLKFEPEKGIPVEQLSNTFINYTKPIIKQEWGKSVLDSVPKKMLPSKPYREWSHLFNFHSLVPLITSDLLPNKTDNSNLGIQVLSNNVLNTAQLNAYIRQNANTLRAEYGAEIQYKRYLPILAISYDNLSRSDFNYVYYRQHQINASVSIPLSFYRYGFIYNTLLGASQSYAYVYNRSDGKTFLNPEQYSALVYTVAGGVNARQAIRNLAPRWGINFYTTYRNYPLGNMDRGNMATLKTTAYTPGLWSNHSLQISFNCQKGKGIYEYRNEIPMVNGFGYFNNSAVKIDNTLLLKYQFPIINADWAVNSYWLANVYIKRFFAGFFADFQNIDHKLTRIQSFGVELNSDLHLFRLFAQFRIGAKCVFWADDVKKPVLIPSLQYGF